MSLVPGWPHLHLRMLTLWTDWVQKLDERPWLSTVVIWGRLPFTRPRVFVTGVVKIMHYHTWPINRTLWSISHHQRFLGEKPLWFQLPVLLPIIILILFLWDLVPPLGLCCSRIPSFLLRVEACFHGNTSYLLSQTSFPKPSPKYVSMFWWKECPLNPLRGCS